MKVITIANANIQIVEYKEKRVLTTDQLAQAYECEGRNISDNFKNNESRFEEGKHYFKLEGEDLKAFKRYSENIGLPVNKFAPVIYLWTRRGASRHCKMLGTDKAWEMFDRLEENYFDKHEQPKFVDSYMIADPVERAKAWIKEQEKVKQLEADNAKQEQIIGELKPKADYTDRILQNKGLVTITQIAKDYGMSGTAMNELLHNLKVIYKLGKQWLLYSKYQAKGYTHSETVDIKHKDGTPDVVMNTKWTQKGRLFLYEVLKKNSVLPVIEQPEVFSN